MHKDLHRARAAAMSSIPTSTGAARAIGLVIPELKGKLDGTSIRIPIPNVSLVSLDVNLRERTPTVQQINDAMKAASQGPLHGVLDYNAEKLVSIDFNHSPASPAPSTPPKPPSSTANSPASWAGTTTNGASRTAWSTPPPSSAAL